MSSFGRPPAAVRMITPPVKPWDSRNSRTMPRRRDRSSRDSIFRDTPTWSTVGMNTRNRPGIVTWDVSRAPLVPSGSLTTWTRISWPSLSRSSIFACCRSRVAFPFLGARFRPWALSVFFRRFELVELFEGVDHFGDVQEPVALEPDVDEGGLHAGQDLRDAALVDIADDASLAFPFDEELRDEVVFENGHDGLVAVRGDDHLLVHSLTRSAASGLTSGFGNACFRLSQRRQQTQRRA